MSVHQAHDQPGSQQRHCQKKKAECQPPEQVEALHRPPMRPVAHLALLHLGPGLANGIANLHNARRARTPASSLGGS